VSFDNSRITFNPLNDYSGVVMEQGRVQSDADWNELLSEVARRIQAGTLDTLGQAVYPATTPFAFQIAPSTTGGSVTIGRGRMYVDGILVENHGLIVNGVLQNASWDPALAELSGSPQPPPASDAAPLPYESQPYGMAAAFPAKAGDYVVYLDVWKQPTTFIEDPSLVDPAIGVDTSGRLKTMWRVSTMPAATGATCQSAAPQWPVSAGQLSNMPATSTPSGPCCLTTGSGYTGVENQLYRVEIHNPGSPSGTGATFKWSRENASVQTTITAINPGTNSAGKPASVLTVASLGRDQVLGFSAGNWVEITNQTNDDLCQPGTLYKIDSVTPANNTITLTTETTITLGSNAYTRLIRWDQAGTIQTSANKTYTDLDSVETGPLDQGFYGIPVPTDGTELILENGIAVSFNLAPVTGSYLPMDYWTFSARVATGTFDTLTSAPPQGLHHHFAQLAIATVDSAGAVTNASNCRTPWASSDSGECGCCTTCTVGVGGTYSTIAAALLALPASGGEIVLLPGDHYENVLISGLRNLVIRGCGWQTHVFSTSLNPHPGASPGTTPASTPPGSESGLPAVFTIVDCENIELRSFSVTAAHGEIGILLDRSALSRHGAPRGSGGLGTEIVFVDKEKGDSDVLLEELILEASTLPAIVAVSVNGLKAAENRIYMKDVASQWAAVYLSGEEMCFERNWVGLGSATEFITKPVTPVMHQPAASMTEEAHAQLNLSTLLKEAKRITAKTGKKTTPKAIEKPAEKANTISEVVLSNLNKMAQKTPGGIHIAGPSMNVCIVENEIVGGIGNGITLGNFIILDDTGADTGKLTGVKWQPEQPCSRGGSTQLPGTVPTGTTTSKIGAGGPILNLHIDRNIIQQMGMAGIGVVGFWNLRETLEIIRIENLSITANVIARTMQRSLIEIDASASGYAYGAISLADVENLLIRDNIITDFGITPGANICGIFVLHGEMVEISRNQIRETRDWADDSLTRVTPANDTRVGILLYLVTPPALLGSAWSTSERELDVNENDFGNDTRFRDKPLYEPGLPALRVQENVVRVAIGLALKAFGYGPFSIVGNHFSSGGPLGDITKRAYSKEFNAPSTDASSYTDPLLVGIYNLGLAIEDTNQGNGYAAMYAAQGSDDGFIVARKLANASSGTVLFTNNICQLEALMSGVRGLTSVSIMSLDNVLFNSNQLWVDGPPRTAIIDGWVFGMTVTACNNRFQESRYYPVLYSAETYGVANITSQNIATYCMKIEPHTVRCVRSPNVILWPLLCNSKDDRVNKNNLSNAKVDLRKSKKGAPTS
jgi:hypothetical protein